MRHVVVKLSQWAGRTFAIWVLLGAAWGTIQPEAFAWVGPRIPILLGIVMFGMGMTLSPKDFAIALSQPRAVLIGVLAQYTVMPLTAFALATALDLPPDLAVGVILLGTCPGGTASNVVTYLARGDVALSVAMTSISTLLAPILTPALTLALAGQWVPVSATALFASIVTIVVLPVLLGLLAHRYGARIVRPITPVLPLISVLAIVAIVSFVVGAHRERIAVIAGALAAAVVLHNVVGLAIGYGIGHVFGLSHPQKRTIALEVGMQNSGLAVSLATMHFAPGAAVPGALFSLWHNITGPGLATYWARSERKSIMPAEDSPELASPAADGK